MILPDKIYNILKWIVMIILPAIATLYTTIANAWGWPYSEPISITIMAIDTFLGTLIGISSKNYNKK